MGYEGGGCVKGGGGRRGEDMGICVAFPNSLFSLLGAVLVCSDNGSFSACCPVGWGGLYCIGWATHGPGLMFYCDILVIWMSSSTDV